jgi:polar amino acid transport system substrate-binding protein
VSSGVAGVAEDLAQTGILRASINLGNPVLAQGTPAAPTGVTVDLARALASRLAVPLGLRCVDAARSSFEAVVTGRADICFLAIEPAREREVAFTAPYALIEGVFVVAQGSAITTTTDVDREEVRSGVTQGSAYDLFLTRTLEHASVIRGDEGLGVFRDLDLEVAAGIRQPMTEFVAGHPGFRVLDGRFMEIQQALGTSRARSAETVRFLRAFVEELKASGFVADALRRAKQQGAAVAPPARRVS